MNKKSEILDRITNDGFPNKEVAISLEEFFDGNDDPGSIGCNIYPDPPTIQDFYITFKRMLASDKVQDIRIRISDANDTEWFYTDAVYIIGDATIEEVTEMVKKLQPDEIYTGWMYGMPVNVEEVHSKNVYSVWWD
ncbi:MAG: hypothetical protein IPP51_10415 [Bacteroidetes bacterium]|nr:hypothetical protein [Bacteroidota bacterium]